MGTSDKAHALRLFSALKHPFCVHVLDEYRQEVVFFLAGRLDKADLYLEAIAPFEPNVPWNYSFLLFRSNLYKATRHPLSARAEADLQEFVVHEPASFAVRQRAKVPSNAGTP